MKWPLIFLKVGAVGILLTKNKRFQMFEMKSFFVMYRYSILFFIS